MSFCLANKEREYEQLPWRNTVYIHIYIHISFHPFCIVAAITYTCLFNNVNRKAPFLFLEYILDYPHYV